MKPIHVMLALDPQFHFDRCVLEGVVQRAESHSEVFIDAKPHGVSFANAVKSGIHAGIIATAKGDQDVMEIAATRLPSVNVTNYLHMHDRVPVVGNDDEVVGRMAANYFTDRGFRHCAFYLKSVHPYFDIRRDSFRNAAKAAGAACTVGPPLDDPNRVNMSGMEWTAKWLTSLPKPVGILAPFDSNAREVIEACVLAGVRVPEEVSVIGVDNDPFYCMTVRPPISSVVTAATQIGHAALKLLLGMIAGEPPPPKPILIPPTDIFERGSTAEAAINDPDVAAAIHFIRANLRHRLTVSKIADQVAVSRRTLERKFADTLERTPLEELRRLRVEHAKRMLVHTDLELADVARLSGLTHTARLSNLIKQFTGTTPRQYRLQNSPNGQ